MGTFFIATTAGFYSFFIIPLSCWGSLQRFLLHVLSKFYPIRRGSTWVKWNFNTVFKLSVPLCTTSLSWAVANFTLLVSNNPVFFRFKAISWQRSRIYASQFAIHTEAMHITCLNASLGSPDITHAIEILTSPWAYTGILHNVSKPQALLFINALFINGFLVWLLATFVNDFCYLFLLLVFSIWCLYYWMYNTRNTVLCSQSIFFSSLFLFPWALMQTSGNGEISVFFKLRKFF